MRKSGLIPLAVALVAGWATQALAQQGQPGTPIPTAQTGSGSVSAGDAVDQQIDAFVRAPLHAASSEDAGVAPERKIHGEVSAGIGTNGYRSFYGRVDIPVGTSSMVSLAASQESMRYRGFNDTRTNLAVAAQLGGGAAALAPSCGWSGLALPGDRPCLRPMGLAPYGPDMADHPFPYR